MLIWVKMNLFPRAQEIPAELVAVVTQETCKLYPRLESGRER